MVLQEKSIYKSLPVKFNLVEFLLRPHLAPRRGGRIAFSEDGKKLTYFDLFDKVRKFSQLLKVFFSSEGERIGILLPDCFEFVISFLGIVWHGNIAVLINEAASVSDIAYILKDSGCKAVVTTKLWQQRLGSERLNQIEHWFITDRSELLNRIEEFDGDCEASLGEKTRPAFFAYTSGSTGRPKGVMHASYSPIVAAHNFAKQTLQLSERDIIYSAPPMAFSYGLGTSLYIPLFLGARSILSSSVDAFGLVKTINEAKPSVFFGLPNSYASILALSQINPLKSESLRICVSAGEKLAESIWKKWKEDYAIEIMEGIGTTETTHIFLCNRPGFCKAGSSGEVVENYDVRIVDEHGNELGPDELGYLQVSGEGMMLGYWQNSEETKKTLLNYDRLRTGDYYQYDENGYYYFMGRKDQLIKINGLWLLPSEIENEIILHPDIKEAAVIFEKSEYIDSTNIISAFVALHDSVENKEELDILRSLKLFLRDRLAKYKVPRRIYQLELLPRTATAKIDYKKLEMLSKKRGRCVNDST